MAKTYTPTPNRRVVNGRAVVSAEELADFKRKYGSDKTLRDLLNMDKGLSRRGGQSMREKFANQYEDPIKAFASAELGMGEGPGAMRKKPMPSKRRVMTPMRGTAFSEEPVSVAAESKREESKPRAGISRDMPSAPSGGGIDDDRRFARTAGISQDMASKPSGGGMDDDRRSSSRSKLYQNLTRAGLTPDSGTSLGSSLGAAATMAAPGVGRMAAGSRTARDVGIARAMSKDAASMPRSAAKPAKDASRTTSETGQRFTPKEQVEAAESTVRGSVNRRNIQETRSAREKMEKEAKRKFMQEEKQSKPFKPGQREDSDVEFRRGGKVKSYANGGNVKGAGAAKRGVRPCKYV